MHYRRAFVEGGTFFFIVVTWQRRPLLQSAAAVNVLRAAFRYVRQRHPFTIGAAVVLPDHLHCLWTLPPDDADFAMRWRLIKSHFTRHCDPVLRGQSRGARPRNGQQAVWQPRYWEHLIRDLPDLARHMDYIHYNPVKHGYVQRPMDWPFSSLRQQVAAGRYHADWGATSVDCGDAGHE